MRVVIAEDLALLREGIASLLKDAPNGPLADADGAPIGRYARKGVPAAILEYDARQSLDLATFASAEAQAAAIAPPVTANVAATGASSSTSPPTAGLMMPDTSRKLE